MSHHGQIALQLRGPSQVQELTATRLGAGPSNELVTEAAVEVIRDIVKETMEEYHHIYQQQIIQLECTIRAQAVVIETLKADATENKADSTSLKLTVRQQSQKINTQGQTINNQGKIIHTLKIERQGLKSELEHVKKQADVIERGLSAHNKILEGTKFRKLVMEFRKTEGYLSQLPKLMTKMGFGSKEDIAKGRMQEGDHDKGASGGAAVHEDATMEDVNKVVGPDLNYGKADGDLQVIV